MKKGSPKGKRFSEQALILTWPLNGGKKIYLQRTERGGATEDSISQQRFEGEIVTIRAKKTIAVERLQMKGGSINFG